ncbi:MAG: IMP cyclohydrolase [Patescibacteria group bacterium]|nr:IMP cyclohydrolase [Patescibacteria group bacterium]
MKRRILISVFDKTGIEKFAALAKQDVEIVSTGGTATRLESEGIKVKSVEKVTGFPEILGGRVKTLHPMIFGGILGDQHNPEHAKTIAEHGIGFFDAVVVNLYDFKKFEDIEHIDIGGVALLRAAAKNGNSCLPVIDPADYDEVVRLLGSGREIPADIRDAFVAKTFEYTAAYDAAIAVWMRRQIESKQPIWPA